MHEPTRSFVGAKLHGIRVTDKSVRYHGSVGIDAELMRAAGIAPFEKVHVVNLHNGARWITYALPVPRVAGRAPVFSLNGGGARLGEIGDECVIMTYVQTRWFDGARVVFLGDGNAVAGETTYSAAELCDVSASPGVPR